MTVSVPSIDREALVRRALYLEYLTVGWNLVEGVIAALAMTPLLVREGSEAWRGEDCGC